MGDAAPCPSQAHDVPRLLPGSPGESTTPAPPEPILAAIARRLASVAVRVALAAEDALGTDAS